MFTKFFQTLSAVIALLSLSEMNVWAGSGEPCQDCIKNYDKEALYFIKQRCKFIKNDISCTHDQWDTFLADIQESYGNNALSNVSHCKSQCVL